MYFLALQPGARAGRLAGTAGEAPASNSAKLKQAGHSQGSRGIAGARLGVRVIVYEESHGTVPVRQLCGLFC